MNSRVLVFVLIVSVTLVCFTTTGTAVYQSPSPPASDFTRNGEIEAQQIAETTAQRAIHIDVRQNGSGFVTVRYRLPLSTTNESTAFERLQNNISSNPSQYRARFSARMDEVVATAQAATGRNMAATSYSVNATRREATGIVTYSFVWRGFAATPGNRLRAGDALTGFYLDNGTQLTITWPTGYEPAVIRPPPDDRRTGSLRWSAPTSFGENEPFVELAPAGSAPNTTRSSTEPPRSGDTDGGTGTNSPPRMTTESPGATDTDDKTGINSPRRVSTEPNASGGPGGGSASDSPLPIALIGIGLGVLVFVAWLFQRRGDEDDHPSDGPTAASTDANDTESPEPTATEAGEEELLSNEERVVRVLEQAGGRAKQQRVVEELGWSEARTSQVVSNLRQNGTITGFRLGRENVLTISEDNTGDDEPPSE